MVDVSLGYYYFEHSRILLGRGRVPKTANGQRMDREKRSKKIPASFNDCYELQYLHLVSAVDIRKLRSANRSGNLTPVPRLVIYARRNMFGRPSFEDVEVARWPTRLTVIENAGPGQT